MLEVLASGKRDGLTSRQQDILDLWPANVSNQVLRTASDNVRWQLGQSYRFLGGLQRSGAYKSHINEVIRQKNLPIELGVLPHVESSFNPSAYSSAAAAGEIGWRRCRPWWHLSSIHGSTRAGCYGELGRGQRGAAPHHR